MQSQLPPTRHRVASILALLVLPPIIGEFLFGSTHITTFFLLFPQIGVYGCGALLIRELVRHLRKGWLALLLLAIAFAIAEECVILQTSFTALFVADPQHIYGRVLGVSWIYLLWALGYESLWCIVLPIQLVELIFPASRSEPWLGKRGLVITGIVFLLSSIGVWYLWNQLALRLFSHQPYHPYMLAIFIALAVIVVLVMVAFWLPSSSPEKATRSVPWPWMIGLIACILGLLWFVLVFLHYGLFPSFPAIIPVGLALALAGGTFFLFRYWSASQRWQDIHRIALIFGALIASMLVGFVASGVTLPLDIIGKLVLNIIALLLLVYLTWKLHRRENIQGDA